MTFAELIKDARAGDPAALELLLARYRPLARHIAHGLLGAQVGRRGDSSDIVQETMARAFNKIDDFRGTTEPEWIGWLRAIITGESSVSPLSSARLSKRGEGAPLRGS